MAMVKGLRGTRGVLGPVMRTGRPVDSNHSVGRVRLRRGFTACSGREIGSEEGVMTTDMSATTQQLLREVESTDNLAPVGKEKRKQIDKLINELIETTANEDPLDNPDIFSNYNVAYTSPGDGQKGAPAGGRYRSRLGRLLFRTTGLYQMIDRPNLAKNLVTFALFGLFPGSIALVGKFEKVNPKTVRVFFEKPKLTLFGKTFNFGPTSSVVLWTPYLSGNLRIGKGSLGSLFVFTKGGKADDPKVIEEFDRRPTKFGWVYAALSLSLAACALFAVQACFGPRPLLAATALLLLTASVLRKGGIVDGNKANR